MAGTGGSGAGCLGTADELSPGTRTALGSQGFELEEMDRSGKSCAAMATLSSGRSLKVSSKP